MWLILLATVVLIWYLHWTGRRSYHHASKISGHNGWPIVGNPSEFIADSNAIFNKVSRHFNSYKHIGKRWIGFGNNKPKYLEKVLTSSKTTSRRYVYRKLGKYTLGNGLFTAPIPTRKRHRKIINPAINQKTPDGFVEVFGKQSTILGDHVENYVDTEKVDHFQIVRRCTLEMACETTIGVQDNAQEAESVVANGRIDWISREKKFLVSTSREM